MTKKKLITRQLGLFVILTTLFLGSCTTEQLAQLEEPIPALNQIPEWLAGDYVGVHTQFPLTVDDTGVSFSYMDQTVFICVDLIDEIIINEQGCTVTTPTDLLLFNKSTVISQINFRYNDMNLGWFVKLQD